MIIAIVSGLALIGAGCVLMSISAIGLFLLAGKHGQERRCPIGDGEPDEPLGAENGTEEMRQE